MYLQLVDALDETSRGAGGYGSTGTTKAAEPMHKKAKGGEAENAPQNVSA